MYAINGAEICFNPSATVGALRLEWINIFNHYPALDEQVFCDKSLKKALMLTKSCDERFACYSELPLYSPGLKDKHSLYHG